MNLDALMSSIFFVLISILIIVGCYIYSKKDTDYNVQRYCYQMKMDLRAVEVATACIKNGSGTKKECTTKAYEMYSKNRFVPSVQLSDDLIMKECGSTYKSHKEILINSK